MRGWFHFTLVVGLLVGSTTVPLTAEAQNLGARLFDRSAAAKADEIRISREDRRYVSSSRSGADVIDDLQPDTAETILLENSRDEFFGDYKGLSYINYLQSAVNGSEFDEIEDSSYAEKAFFYQTAKLVGENIKNSPMDTYYRKVLSQLKFWKRKTTVQFVQGDTGELDVNKGELEEDSLLEFKLHATARNGIEPRVSIGKRITLRVDPFSQGALLEYGYDF